MTEHDGIADDARRDPQMWIGVDAHANGSYVYVRGARGERRIQIDGQYCEHVDDDADGCWLYRAMVR